MTARKEFEIAPCLDALYQDGITSLKAAFSCEWVERLREEMMTAFWEAIQRPGGAVSRGPRRWYVETHPQAFTGFADLVAHPWVSAMAEAVLGPRYEIVEIGLDVTFQRRQTSAVAPRLPFATRELGGASHHLAGL